MSDSENILEERSISFSQPQIHRLLERTPLLQYADQIQKSRAEIHAQLEEIRDVQGSWEKKDKILKSKHGLFNEFKIYLETFTNCIQQYWETDKNDKNQDIRVIRMHNRQKDKWTLIQLLMNQIIKVPTDQTTHKDMDRALRTLQKRFDVAFDKWIEIIAEELQFASQNELVRNIQIHLKQLPLPKICPYRSPERIKFMQLFTSNQKEQLLETLGYNRRYTPNTVIEPIYEELIFPKWGNEEYYLGLKPLWIDQIGSGLSLYFFATKHDPQPTDLYFWVICTPRPITDFTCDYLRLNPDYPSWTQMFEKADLISLFKGWLFTEGILQEFGSRLWIRHIESQIEKRVTKQNEIKNEYLKHYINTKWALLQEVIGSLLPPIAEMMKIFDAYVLAIRHERTNPWQRVQIQTEMLKLFHTEEEVKGLLSTENKVLEAITFIQAKNPHDVWTPINDLQLSDLDPEIKKSGIKLLEDLDVLKIREGKFFLSEYNLIESIVPGDPIEST